MTRRCVAAVIAELADAAPGPPGDRERPPGRWRAAPGPVPAHVPARERLARRQEGLRRRRLRRVHGPRRRDAGAQLHFPRRPRGRLRGDDDRGAGAAPAAGRVPGRPGIPVRLLHGRNDHDGGGAAARGSARTSRGRSRGTSAAAPATGRSAMPSIKSHERLSRTDRALRLPRPRLPLPRPTSLPLPRPTLPGPPLPGPARARSAGRSPPRPGRTWSPGGPGSPPTWRPTGTPASTQPMAAGRSASGTLTATPTSRPSRRCT